MKKHLLNFWRPVGFCWFSASLCPIALHPAVAQPTDAQPANTQPTKAPPVIPPNKTVEEYLDQLKDPNIVVRRDAVYQLANIEDRLHHSVIMLLAELRKTPDHRWSSPFAMTLRVVAKMKIHGFTHDFGDMLDFQLDPATFPRAGYDGVALSYYPVAQTVVDLKDWPETIELVMDRFNRTASDTTLRVHTYVLQQVLGEKWAKLVVESNLDNWKKKLVVMPNSTDVQIMIANLESALKLLDSSDLIIKQPAEPEQKPKTAGT